MELGKSMKQTATKYHRNRPMSVEDHIESQHKELRVLSGQIQLNNLNFHTGLIRNCRDRVDIDTMDALQNDGCYT